MNAHGILPETSEKRTMTDRDDLFLGSVAVLVTILLVLTITRLAFAVVGMW